MQCTYRSTGALVSRSLSVFEIVSERHPCDAEDRPLDPDPDCVARSNVELGLEPNSRSPDLTAETSNGVPGPQTDVSTVGIIGCRVKHEIERQRLIAAQRR